VTFDQENRLAHNERGTHAVLPFVQDSLSILYFTRALDLSRAQPGDVILVPSFEKDRSDLIRVRVHGREEVKVAAGRFRALRIEPEVGKGGLFKSKGRIEIWLSDDARRLPLRVRSGIILGSIDAELTDYDGLAGPLEAKLAAPR
jgi:hypothetical protein